MSIYKLRTTAREVQEYLEAMSLASAAKRFCNELEEAIGSVEEEIADLEDELDESGAEVRDLKRKVNRLEDDIEDLESDIEDLKDTSERCHESLEDELKEEWWNDVRKKYTLVQLESVLGNRFNLKDI